MERWVAIILGLLVLVIGFIVVSQIIDSQDNITEAADGFACRTAGGTCQESCSVQTISDADCSQGQVCCPFGG